MKDKNFEYLPGWRAFQKGKIMETSRKPLSVLITLNFTINFVNYPETCRYSF